jgi:hypothetical protein
MRGTLFVVPAQGRTVRDPQTMEILPPEGDTVPKSTYWLRRLQDGDVILGRQVSQDVEILPEEEQPAQPAARPRPRTSPKQR